MATYKVIQDIEAEDKLVGPLTLRQFVYAGITGICLYLCYFVISRGAAFLVVALIPPALIAAFFAFPWSREQPTELWALARIRFLFKPRKRIWNQSGMKQLVTVTAPKKVETVLTDGLTQMEVKSRLQALASTIDSRGWAIKGGYTPPNFAQPSSGDRLISIDSLPQEIPGENPEAYPDMLDPAHNRIAAQFDNILTDNAEQHRQQLMTAMQQTANDQLQAAQAQPQAPADYWFMNQTPGANQAHVVTPGATDDPFTQPAQISHEEEAALVEQLKARNAGQAREYSHLPTILPLAEQERLAKQQAAQAAQSISADNQSNAQLPQQQPANNDATAATQTNTSAASAMTDEPDAAILELARNDDLNVETIARQANKAHGDNDEVVISLH